MNYNDCTPIEPKLAQPWLVELPNGEKLLVLVDPKFTVPELHQMLSVYFRKFKFSRLDVGQLHVSLQGDDHTYSGDSRRINQEWEVE